MRRGFLVSAILVAGCGDVASEREQDRSVAAGEPMAAPVPKAASPRPVPAAEPVLTAEGFGPLRIGMTRAQVVEAMGEDSDPEAVGGPDPESCDEFRPARAPEACWS